MSDGRTSPRYGWSLIDQIVSSATNVLVALLVARRLSSARFGEFSILFSIYIIGAGFSRAWTTDPLAVRFSGRQSELDKAVSSAVAVAVTIGCVVGTAVAAVGLAVGKLSVALAIAAALLPALFAQDCLRIGLIVAGRARAAAANDTIWMLVTVVSLFAFHDRLSVATGLGCWGAGDLSGRYTIEYLVNIGTGYMLVPILGAVAGLSAAGGVRGAQVLLGPLSVVFAATSVQAISHLARLGDDPQRVHAIAKRASLGLSIIAGAYGVLLLLVPDRIGMLALGASWRTARDLVPAVVTSWVMIGLYAGASFAIRSQGLASIAVRVQVITSAVTIALVVAGAAASGVEASLWALAIGNLVSAFVWWHAWISAFRGIPAPNP